MRGVERRVDGSVVVELSDEEILQALSAAAFKKAEPHVPAGAGLEGPIEYLDRFGHSLPVYKVRFEIVAAGR